ncbi:MAG: hypothetical protein V3W41_20035 [Planctomycetota bacterium]
MSARILILFVAVAILAGAAYLPTLSHEFVYDDHRFVAANPAVRDGVGIMQAIRDPKILSVEATVGGAYRPLRTYLWGRLAQFFASDEALPPAAYRALNILLHLMSVLFLALIGQRLGLAPLAAAAGALLFGLHPMAAETVAWVSSLGDGLALCFSLLALLVFLQRPRLAVSIPCLVVAAFLAVMGKEMAVTLPLVLGLAACADGQGGLRARIWELASVAFLVAAYLFLRTAALSDVGTSQNARPVLQALWDMGQGLSYYAGAYLLVLTPRFDWYWDDTSWLAASLGWLLFFALAGSVVYRWHRRGLGASSLLAGTALIALLPVLQVVPLNIVAADRFFYPSLAFFSLAFAKLLLKYCPPKLAIALFAGIIVIASLRLFAVQKTWADEQSLWEPVVEREDAEGGTQAKSSRARYNLGRAIMARIDRDRAESADPSLDGRRAYKLIRNSWQSNFGGRAVLVKAANYGGDPAGAIAAGGALFDDWIEGKPDADPNLDAVIELMHRSAQKIGMRADLSRPNFETQAAAASLGRSQSFLGRLRVLGPKGQRRLVEFLKIRGFLQNLAGRQTLALSDFRYVLQELKVSDLDVRTWRVSILAGIVGKKRRDEILAEYQALLGELPPAHRPRMKAERAAFLARLAREKGE